MQANNDRVFKELENSLVCPKSKIVHFNVALGKCGLSINEGMR